MKNKIILKCIFVVIQIILLIGLVYIIISKAGTGAHIYAPVVLTDYKIIDETTDCNPGKELIYSDSKYNYYLKCTNSQIFILWDDGAKDSLKFDLSISKLTIDSLIEHGLNVEKYEK